MRPPGSNARRRSPCRAGQLGRSERASADGPPDSAVQVTHVRPGSTVAAWPPRGTRVGPRSSGAQLRPRCGGSGRHSPPLSFGAPCCGPRGRRSPQSACCREGLALLGCGARRRGRVPRFPARRSPSHAGRGIDTGHSRRGVPRFRAGQPAGCNRGRSAARRSKRPLRAPAVAPAVSGPVSPLPCGPRSDEDAAAGRGLPGCAARLRGFPLPGVARLQRASAGSLRKIICTAALELAATCRSGSGRRRQVPRCPAHLRRRGASSWCMACSIVVRGNTGCGG